ncbi:MAG: translocation/assembly module TamB domain-containing protein [Acidobacteriaceae bacterium]
MSDAPNLQPASSVPPAADGKQHPIWRAALVAVVVILLLIVGGIWYVNTPAFAKFVRGKVVSALEQATGGRVDMGAFHWRLLHLEFEVDNLTIHGLEGPGQVPYAHVDRIYVRAKIISLLERKFGLNYFEADHPVIHLIVYPDGSTNQPHPKVKATSKKPAIDTIFDLKVNRAEVRDGVVMVNQRATPFNASANDLGVMVTYVPAKGSKESERYLGRVHVEDLTMERGGGAALHSTIDAQMELGRNQVVLQSLQLRTGDSLLNVNGSLINFANPTWQLNVKGGVALGEMEALTHIAGLKQGEVQIDLHGGGAKAQFKVDGAIRVEGASYHAGSIHVTGVRAQTRLHLTRDDLALTGLRLELSQGGYIDGEMKVTHWRHPAKAAAVPKLPPKTARALRRAKAVVAKPEVQQGTIRAQLHGLGLASIMGIVAPSHYSELGFDTAASGSAKVNWTGSAMAFTAAANVTLTPPLKTVPGRVPMFGTVEATYSNVKGLVDIADLDVHTPASEVKVTGSLGAYPITRASNMQVTLNTSDISEFDPALTTLGVAAGGKKGLKALPVSLHGKADFTGTITDSILNPDVKGHVDATDFDLTFSAPKRWDGTTVAEAGPQPERTVHWDAIHADAEYSQERIAVSQAVLTHGPATVHVSGELDAHRVSARRSEFDEESPIRADVSVRDADIGELLKMAGKNLAVTGTLNLTAHASGTLENLDGGGHVSVLGGAIYGESYKSLNTDLRFAGSELGAVHLVFVEDGGSITGGGGYDLKAKAFHFDARGTGFDLAKIHRLQSGKYTVAGMLAFEAHGSGTIQKPDLQANLHLTRLNLDGVAKGFVNAEAHTQGRTLLVDANANIANAQLQVHGQTQLTGDNQTQAKLTLANLDVDPILEAVKVEGVSVHSSIGATVNVSGPLREPRRMNGDATVQQFAVTLAGVALKSDGALHATLKDGLLHLDPVHIMGQDTDLRAHGTLAVLTAAHGLNMHASGAVNMKLAQSLNKNIRSSGRVDFQLDTKGTLAQPVLTGNVKFTDVAVSMLTFPNGLSKMNGTLTFDQDRLEVKSLTAVSGGGQLTAGGFITYQQGFYGDLTATAKGVRIRYPEGMSSMVDAKLRLQGTKQSALLSGGVTITRFALTSGLDLASFNPSAMGPALPPNPKSLSNHVRLDIHVVSAPQLDFQNSFAKLAGDVDLRVRGTIAQPTVLGHISITEGNATFAGTKYELQHGDILFSNPVPINPTLDLSATAQVEGYDITIGLAGTAAKPVPTFRSEPPLSEQDIFSLLAMGRTQEEQQIYSSMQARAGVNSTADALLGGALNATVSNRIQKLFGGGSVKIDPTFVTGTGNATARITVEEQISKYATLTYATNVNSTAEQLIQAQVNLTQNFSVLAVRDEAGVFSMIFKLRRRYR